MLGVNLDSACDPTGNVVDCNRGVRCRQVNTDKLLGRLGGLSGDIAEGDRNIEELRRDEAFVVQAVSKPCVHVPDRRCHTEWYRRGGSRQNRCTIWRAVAWALRGAPGRAADAVDVNVEQRGREAGRDGEDSSALGEKYPYVCCAGGDGFEGLTGPRNGDSAASTDRKNKDSAGSNSRIVDRNGLCSGKMTSSGRRMARKGAEVTEHKA